ncbi:nuclear transport factor 2 family protein [Larkinella sp. VNQ87]|uniref:nuclear transport factor 2 family protein n=1 Tax=Larkinella sp. VNQ87 TaxID=3400921 RepID=UPI003C071DA7
MQQIELNKAIVRDFYRRVLANGDLAYAEQITADDYIQHSPTVKPGKAGLLEALRYMSQLPKPASPAKPFLRLIAEGEYVVTNLSFVLGGQPKAVVDLFRLRNGQMVEHWDAIEDQPETSPNGHPMLNGATEIEDHAMTERNKDIVGRFFQPVFIEHRFDWLADFVAPELMQHHPEIANGLDGLQKYLSEKNDRLTVQTVLRTIAEGNFVVVQSAGQFLQKPATFYDIFRLLNEKIVEQWSVKQVMP